MRRRVGESERISKDKQKERNEVGTLTSEWIGLDSWNTSLRPKFRGVCERNTKRAKPGLLNNEERRHNAPAQTFKKLKKVHISFALWRTSPVLQKDILWWYLCRSHKHMHISPQQRWMPALNKTRKMCLECLLEVKSSCLEREKKARWRSAEGDECRVFECLALNQHNGICESQYDKQIKALTSIWRGNHGELSAPLGQTFRNCSHTCCQRHLVFVYHTSIRST